MSATITGVGSGFDINGWVSQLVSAKQASTLAPLQSKLKVLETKNSGLSSLKSKYSTLQSSLQAFTKIMYNSSSDMWANTSITSSNDAYATAKSSGVVSAAKVDLKIEQIATATTAKSVNSLGTSSVTDIENVLFTNLANGQAKEGSFSLFLDGKEYSVEIEETDTLRNVMDKIYTNTDGKVEASLTDGVFSINAGNPQENTELLIGSSADESNFVSALKLFERVGTTGYQSPYVLSAVHTDKAMASSEAGLGGINFFDEEGNEAESGKIYINGVEIEINKNTSLNDLISKINGNADTNVKATYDSLTNKFILTSTETGQNNISLSSEGTDLLNVLGLTTGRGEEETIAKDSQTLGQNAIAYINGNRVVSTSNTITGETSGVTNLSITIKKPTSEYSADEKDPLDVSLDIEPDYTDVKAALKKFVDAYNDVINSTKTMTSSTGQIGRDSSLNSLITQIKGLTSKVSENDGVFSMLADIGISASQTNPTNLSIDDSKLEKALRENFNSVKSLISDGYEAKEDNGLFDQLLSTVNGALNVENGYFKNALESVETSISGMNSRIERANERISKYEIRMTNQFNKMDSVIASLNAQLSTFQSYLG